MQDDLKILPAGSGFQGIRFENGSEILAEFGSSALSDGYPTFKVEQIRMGDIKIGNRFSSTDDELYMHVDVGSSDVQLVRLGREISAINTDRLFLSSLSLLHESSATGSTGLSIFNTGGNGNSWNLYTVNGNGNLEFFFKGDIKARVRSTDGAWVTNSDRRFKTDIARTSTILPKIMKLKVSSYKFKDSNAYQNNVGFIAQEVNEVFPDLVFFDEEKEYYGLNYTDFGVLAIKGIQELAEELELQKDKNNALSDELEKLRKDVQILKENRSN